MPRKGPGQPSKIDAIVSHRDDGTPITVFDRIVSALRVGQYFEHATAQAGVSKETAYGWLRLAGRLKIEAKGQLVDVAAITAHEARCIEFSDAVAEAESSWEAGALATLERLARGGVKVTKTVTKRDGAGDGAKVLEVTTTEEVLAPNAQVIEWRLTRRFPGRYGQRVEITGADGGPLVMSVEDRTDALASQFEAYLAGVDATKPKPRARKKKPVAVTDGPDSPGPP